MKSYCRQNGAFLECVKETEKGWIAHETDLRTGETALCMRQRADGIYTVFLPENERTR